ncbi:MAG: hypothetical protein RLZZ486_183, partial [Actinomycetota bacterium]
MRLRSLISLSETTHALMHSNNVNLIAIPSATPFLVADQAKEKQVLLVAHSSQRATELAQELAELIDGVMEFPAWETLPHEKLSPNSDTVARRVQTLLNIDKAKVVVTSARALVQPIVASAIELPILQIFRGQEFEFETLISNLVLRAYNRVDMVERRGDFAVRGGIIDVFPPLSSHPVRIEFFGDEIEELKYFEISDQRSFEAINSPLNLIPCREVLITEEVKARAHDLKTKYPELLAMCNKIEEGIYVEGIESLAAVLTPKMKTLVEYIPNNSKVILLEQERIKSRVQDLISTNQEFLAAAWSNIALTSKSDAVNPQIPLRTELQIGAFVELDKLKDLASDKGISWSSINSFGFESDPEVKEFLEIEPYRNKVEKLIADVRNHLADGYLVVISVAGHGLQERYRDIFQEADIPAVIKESIDTKLVRGSLYLISSSFRNGFKDVVEKILFITEAEITGSRDNRISATRMPSRRKKSIDPLELKSGDYVVHEQHGVGRYIELVQRTVAGASREYLVIEYAASKRGQPADRIYVPTEALEQITRYVGGETPAVNRIGGGDWIKAKSRAKKAVKEIAGELIRLYAAR